MNVFIDTNVLLDFFRMSSADLEELRKLSQLSRTGSIKLFLSEWLTDEFARNREKVIADALKQFEESKFQLHRPNIIRPHSESVKLEHLQQEVKDLKNAILKRASGEAASGQTQADKVVKELFGSATIEPVQEDTIDAGIRRTQLRKPPGKKDSCGDGIHWEWLLLVVPRSEDLHIISRDGDFESLLSKGDLDSYLAKEWAEKKSSQCHLYGSLSSFLKAHFGNIQLADQLAKGEAIEKLEQSGNFATTHNAISRLSAFDDFTKEELERLIEAYESNRQIHWIVGDDDVKEFAEKLITLSLTIGLSEQASSLQEMLAGLEQEDTF